MLPSNHPEAFALVSEFIDQTRFAATLHSSALLPGRTQKLRAATHVILSVTKTASNMKVTQRIVVQQGDTRISRSKSRCAVLLFAREAYLRPFSAFLLFFGGKTRLFINAQMRVSSCLLRQPTALISMAAVLQFLHMITSWESQLATHSRFRYIAISFSCSYLVLSSVSHSIHICRQQG